MIMSINARFFDYMEQRGRAQLRHKLLTRSDRFLADTGFSRELLEQGVQAWPWRLSNVDAKSSQTPLSRHDYQQAVAELNAYSDAELADLGLSRAGIKQAVRYGRPHEDDYDNRRAA